MIDDFADFIRGIGGSNQSAFEESFHERLDAIDTAAFQLPPQERAGLLRHCFNACSAELDQSAVHRVGRHKPMGYAGDFQIIDYIYTHFTDSPGRGKLWDEFFHRQVAPRAVRARKDMFQRQIATALRNASAAPLRVLNVASGPCRDIADACRNLGLEPKQVEFDCVEIDLKAIAYATTLIGAPWNSAVRFHHANALRFRTTRRFDLVWSAGLLDYLDDRVASLLLRTLLKVVAPGGVLVVGNFAASHASRPYLEWCGAWFLHHRTDSEMGTIAAQAGIQAETSTYWLDDLKAIGFCSATKPRLETS